ncbi:MAG: acyl-CoA dehydrogenase [SAR202 cluster bacterium]|nr:acyl-CoA dehydrogenase [SAR202 cluster bacterium]
MDIQLTEPQQMLKRTARALLQKECPVDKVRALESDPSGYDPSLWRLMAGQGWLGWAFPAEYGGAGGDFFDLALLMEEMGYAAAPSPFLASVAMGGMAVLGMGSHEQKSSLLPRVASGELVLSLAYLEGECRPDHFTTQTIAENDDGGFVLNGQKLLVPFATSAHKILCLASADGKPLLLILDPHSPGVTLRPMASDSGESLCELNLHNVQVGVDSVLGQPESHSNVLPGVIAKAAALRCAQIVGACERVLDITVDYVKRRVQFGRPIGAFQSVQHHVADIYRDLHMCRLLSYQACWNISEGLPFDAPLFQAQIKVMRAAPTITRLAHQVVGGVGYYKEFPLELLTRRVTAWAASLGTPDTIARRLADALWV